MEETIKLKNYISPKSEAMVRASITRKFEEMVCAYPKIPVAHLVAFVFRSAGEVQGDPWNWKDERTLKKIEGVQRQLLNDYSSEVGDFIDEPIDSIL